MSHHSPTWLYALCRQRQIMTGVAPSFVCVYALYNSLQFFRHQQNTFFENVVFPQKAISHCSTSVACINSPRQPQRFTRQTVTEWLVATRVIEVLWSKKVSQNNTNNTKSIVMTMLSNFLGMKMPWYDGSTWWACNPGPSTATQHSKMHGCMKNGALSHIIFHCFLWALWTLVPWLGPSFQLFVVH